MTAPWQSVEVRVADESDVGEARRAARAAARALGFGDVAAENAAIVAAEASRNVVLHGGGGNVVITPSARPGALDLVALDRGPGIADLERALRDGYSTAGTAGQGLGAMRRIASAFDLYSAPARGTALLARIEGLPGPARPAPARVEAGAVCLAVASERACGDAWAIAQGPDGPVVLVADGLGHGPLAAQAAEAAVEAFHRCATLPVERALGQLHAALRSTRGAAIAIAQVDRAAGRVRFAGIGNISGTVVGSTHMRRMVSLPGTAGHEARSIRSFEYEWPAGAALVLHSDGVATRWAPGDYPGLLQRDPALIAGVLHRDFGRGRDDATVVVLPWRGPP